MLPIYYALTIAMLAIVLIFGVKMSLDYLKARINGLPYCLISEMFIATLGFGFLLLFTLILTFVLKLNGVT